MANPIARLIQKAENRKVDNIWVSGGLMAATPIIIFFIGILSLEATFQWGATTTDKEGNIRYANQVSLRGWDAVPFQAIAGLVGAGGTAYAAYKASTKEPAPPSQS